NGSASPSSKLLDVALGIPGEDVFFPAIADDTWTSHLLLTYTRSSSSHGPIDEVAALHLGNGVIARGRTVLRSFGPASGSLDGNGDLIWGDYSGIAMDSSDLCLG